LCASSIASPTLVRRVKLYTKEVPLFEHFGIQDEISKALRSKVCSRVAAGPSSLNRLKLWVASTSHGKYVGKSARLEDTIVQDQPRCGCRRLSARFAFATWAGIIVIDFIDMDERKNRFKVLAALEEALKADRAPTKVLQFNDFWFGRHHAPSASSNLSSGR